MLPIGEWLKRPVVLGITCWALGAGMAVLFLGVPALWTSTAAGWAAAVGTLAAATVALYLGRMGQASARLVEETHTMALAVMVLPFVEEYGQRLDEIEKITAWRGTPEEREFYAGTLFASLQTRKDLSSEGQKFNAAGMASLLHNWAGAAPWLVRDVAELAAHVNTVSALLRTPFRVAPEEGNYNQGPLLLEQLYEQLGATARRTSRLREICPRIAAAVD